MYSPTQAASGAALGGPIGVVYFLWANFKNLGRARAAKITVWSGLAGTILVLILALTVPDNTSSAPFTLAYILIARSVSSRWQMSKEAIASSSNHHFHSNWRVFWMGMACLLVTVILLLVTYFVPTYLGWDFMNA